jgi:carboxymethylenebutenolidase
MKNQTRLIAEDGHQLDAYVNPVTGAKAAVVVLQEIFGVNHHIRSVVDKFAQAGFWAIAPALFDRAQPGVELNYDDKGMEEGKKIAYGLKPDDVLKDIAAALRKARTELPDAKVGVVGYCFGGSYAWLSATRLDPQASVCFYGSMVAKFATENPSCPVQTHFGKKDKSIPESDIEKIRQAHPEIEIYLYDAGHGFSCNERASYSPEASSLAFSRTIEFFHKHLAPPGHR